MFVPPSRRIFFASISLVCVSFAWAPSRADAQDKTKPLHSHGAKIYAERCAACHGVNGEGVEDEYAAPLFGDQPTLDLAEYIDKAMPEGEPEECEGDDALAVARWMQDAFYSATAQARIHPPRRRLSRLTVSQFRHAVADLAGNVRPAVEPGEDRGLVGQYYKSRRLNNRDKAFERLDDIVDFDFGKGTPDAEKIPKNEEFAIGWKGSLIIEETGWYEFILKTENGGKLFVNDPNEPLIDAWVKSGYDTEYRGSRFLLAGRLYPIRIEWFTYKEATASIALWWRPPHGADHVVPNRHLTSQSSQQVVVVETPFPPDDRSDGYVRGTSVSKEWDEAVTFAAVEAADKVLQMLPALAKLKRGESDEARRLKIKEFCTQFAALAFRRPLSSDVKERYIDVVFADDSIEGVEEAARRSLLGILKSPRFLYREITGENDTYTKASRLSFALIDSIPDQTLVQAVEKGRLNDPSELRSQAVRLADSFRGRTRLKEFLRVWLQLERIEDMGKDAEVHPDFTPELVGDLRTSLELLLDESIQGEDGFRTLLTSKQVWLNSRLRAFYGLEPIEQPGFQKVTFEPEHRAGVVSHPFMLSGLAYQRESSPIHRGVFLARGILGRTLKPPPDAVTPVAPELEPELTTRQRIAKQTGAVACASCHKLINALGFSLEEFDAVGRFRVKEKDQPIDAQGSYRVRTGETEKFRGAVELSQFLVNSVETRRSFARQLFHHLVQQPVLAYGPESIDQLADYFEEHQLRMNRLMAEIACRSAEWKD